MSERGESPQGDAVLLHQLTAKARARNLTRPAGVTIGGWRLTSERIGDGIAIRSARIGGRR